MNGRKELQEVWTEADSSKSLDTALRGAPAGIGCWERLGGFGQCCFDTRWMEGVKKFGMAFDQVS